MPDTQHNKHDATETEASNGMGTADAPRGGATQDRPILDGSTETYDPNLNPRFGDRDPELVRDTETDETTITPEGY